MHPNKELKTNKQRFVQTQSKSQHSLDTQELNSSGVQINYTNLNLYRFDLSNHTHLPHFPSNQDKARNKSKPKSQTQKIKNKDSNFAVKFKAKTYNKQGAGSAEALHAQRSKAIKD
jgi:hypothetical protein